MSLRSRVAHAYSVSLLSGHDIARAEQISLRMVYRLLQEAGIQRRARSEACRIAYSRRNHPEEVVEMMKGPR